MLISMNEYVASVEGDGKRWLMEFYSYMSEFHADISYVMFRQRPMYKIGESYLMFTAAKAHFSVHTLNFDLIETFRKSVPGAGSGKGCVSIKYTEVHIKPLLKALCDEVILLNSQENPPPVDVAPELPYEQQLEKVFSLSKAKWRGLYEDLLKNSRERLPAFHEYFPALGILWKHGSTFAQIKCTKSAMQLEFYAARLYEDREPVKYLQTSAKRVMHMVELTDENDNVRVLPWIEESYNLTKK